VKAERTLSDVRTQTDDMQRRAMKMMDEAKSKVEDAVEQGKDAARKVRKDASDSASELTSGNSPVG
jgi:hypothetical protein